MGSSKYTKEMLTEAAANSYSIRGVVRYLGLAQVGGNNTHIKQRLINEGIDISHFTGQGHGKGKRSVNRKTPTDILIVLPAGSYRPKCEQIKRAMIEVGIEYRCICGLTDQWQGRKIVLEVDHIDGDWLNNLQDNLRFLCPNCHSQQETNRGWKNKPA